MFFDMVEAGAWGLCRVAEIFKKLDSEEMRGSVAGLPAEAASLHGSPSLLLRNSLATKSRRAESLHDDNAVQ